MKKITLKAHKCSGGRAEGEALVARRDALALGGDVALGSGKVITPGHELHQQKIADKILVFPTGRGSTADPYLVYFLMKRGNTPKGVINLRANPTTVAGAVICGIPMVHMLDRNPLEIIETGDMVTIDADRGIVEVVKVDR